MGRDTKLRFLIIIMITLLLSSSLPLENSAFYYHSLGKCNTEVSKRFSISDYTQIEPIVIYRDFDWFGYGFPGDGSESDPYKIEGYLINSSSICINITYTHKYFQIRNCVLTSPSDNSSNFLDGIYLKGVINADISNCIIMKRSYGISITWTECIVKNNQFSNCLFGIAMEDPRSGQAEEPDTYAILEGNRIENCSTGISSQYTVNKIENNTILNCGLGFRSHLSEGNFSNNTITGCIYGIDSSDYNYIMDQNTISNCDTGILSLTGTYSRNRIFNTSIAVQFSLSEDLLGGTLIENEIYQNEIGIFAQSNCILSSNSIWNNSDCGIELRGVENVLVFNNSIFNNEDGLYLSSYYDHYVKRNIVTMDCVITNNSFSSNTHGINCEGSAYNKIYWNNFSLNSVNAVDSGNMNQWDDGFNTGNYWHDYDGLGVYLISDGNGVDRYPNGTIPVDLFYYGPPIVFSIGIITIAASGIIILKRKRIGK